jgi:K+-sensing histidine kinase KdpD
MNRVRAWYESLRNRLIDILYRFDVEHRLTKPRVYRYSFAVAAILSVTLAKIVLENATGTVPDPFHFFLVSIIASTWYGGLGPGLFSVMLSMVFADYFFLPPRFTLVVFSHLANSSMRMFILDGVLMIWFIDIVHATLYRMQKSRLEHKESQIRLAHIANNVPALIWKTNVFDVCDYSNTMLKQYVPNIEKTDRRFIDILAAISHPNDVKKIEVLKKKMKKFDAHQTELRIKNLRGTYDWFLIKTEPLFTFRQTYNGYIGIGALINQKKQLERQKSQFISITSHELKTPLTTIKAFAQLVQRKFAENKKIPTASLEHLSKITEQVDVMTVFINDLLDVSRIERGKLPINKEKADISEIVADTVSSMRSSIASHELILRPIPSVIVDADHQRISQVLINFIDNAVKYSPQRTTIEIGGKLNKDSIKIYVTDQGNGVPKSEQKSVFQRFYQSDPAEPSRSSGIGLGLYISREIIKKHSGRIGVTSIKGKGSTFYFTLPLAK